ncbi:MAG: transposase [Gloeocapsa sp. UFS-A4-WI-NPMV-4B04]|nr:transposase [Gloeocapsa sp. UFS-A4-WI-NPMV-4B04]
MAPSEPYCQACWPRSEQDHRQPRCSGCDSRENRKAIFNRGMVPNITENLRGRKTHKRGRKPLFDRALYQERFFTIERVFAWEDKFWRLLLRFERISELHYAMKTLAYTMINLRHFCQS